MKKRRLILVDWEDPFGDNRWHKETDVSSAEPMVCHTVGWKMPARRGYLSLASSRDEQGKCSDRMTIPRKNIKSIRIIE